MIHNRGAGESAGCMSTTVTTVTTTTILTFGSALGLMLTLALIAFLVAKELATADESPATVRWGKVLNVGVVPLLVSFVCIVGVKLAALM